MEGVQWVKMTANQHDCDCSLTPPPYKICTSSIIALLLYYSGVRLITTKQIPTAAAHYLLL